MSGSTPADVLELTTDPADALAIMGTSNRIVRDDFAGPGGWSTGIRDLLEDADLVEVALEWDASACLTRVANGHVNTLRADVAAYPVCPFLGRTIGYIGSPPCQTFSMAGGGSGRAHLALMQACVRGILLGTLTYDEAMTRLADAGALDRPLDKRERATLEGLLDGIDDEADRALVEAEYLATLDLVDPRNGLILIPARVIRALLDHDGQGPTDLEWVALEQVVPAAPVFDAYAQALRELGFSAVSVTISAADYGVPQDRERRFVLASRTRRVNVPEPTHAAEAEPEGLFGPGRLRWPSMARALGWGMPRPYFTVTGKHNAGFFGGSAARAAYAAATEADDFVPRPEDERDLEAVLLERIIKGTPADAAWVAERPSTTVAGASGGRVPVPGYRINVGQFTAPGGVHITEAEGGILQGFPVDYRWEGLTKGKRWEQIGNVVCPPVARRIIATLLGLEDEAPVEPLPWHRYAWDEAPVPF